MADLISMHFPADTEYIGTIRLAISGIAGMKDYTVDEIEDLKSCTAEACLLLLGGQKSDGLHVDIEVADAIHVKVYGKDIYIDACESLKEFNEEISRLMIEALSEHVIFEEHNGILHSISFTKERIA